ncbi:uridylate-specific endoribonuclease A-like [Clavelina lepadiformis]|uniref:uridylate-specific endoribonuclease A-like n=1 Tax=Clavelina lepadiformis TaxID=159417 RepID=UPI004042596F
MKKTLLLILNLFVVWGLLAECGSISDQDILDWSRQLYEDDANDRISAYQVDTRPHAKRFFIHVDNTKFNHAIYDTFRPLLNNYNRNTGRQEIMTNQKKKQISQFLDTFINGPVGSRLFNFLKLKGKVSCRGNFKNALYNKWFALYSRSRNVLDSSGFEHVFVGEVKSTRNEVIGFHNWVQYYLQENGGRIQFVNHLRQSLRSLHSLKFKWHNALKRCSGFAVGVSPAYDLAIFTLCHIAKPGNKCTVSYPNNNGIFKETDVQTYTWENTPHIASAHFLC